MEPRIARWTPTPPALAALASGLALSLGAAPSVSDRDAGELATAAFHLDVAHPTGFVLDMVLFRLAALAPVGDVAFRMNLCVAAMGAAACAVLASLVDRALRDRDGVVRATASLLPTAVLVASATMVRAWTAVEVYASSVLIACAALSLAMEGADLARRRRAVAALSGVALLSMHTSARPAVALSLAMLTVPGLVTMAWRARFERLAAVLVPWAATLPLVVWLPIASRRNGPVDWGNPETFAGVRAHVSAALIREAFAKRMLVAWRIPEDLAHAGEVIAQDLGPIALAVAIVGALRAAREPFVRALLAVALVDLAYAVAINPMGIVDRQTFFHTELCLAIFAALGVASIATRAGARERIVGVVLTALVAAATVAHRDARWVGRADGWTAPEILGGAGALGAVPARTLVLCSSDDLCGGALYAQHVEGERPDVVVLPRQHVVFDWTWRRLDPRRLGDTIAPPVQGVSRASEVARTLALLEHYGDRVRWEGSGDGEARAIRRRRRFGGGETPVLAVPGAEANAVDEGAAAWVNARGAGASGVGARWIGAMVTFAAGSRVATADMQRAVPLWMATLTLDPTHVSAYTNLGVAAARRGDLTNAIGLTRAALALDPERPLAWRNLAEFLRVVGDAAGAHEADAEAARRSGSP